MENKNIEVLVENEVIEEVTMTPEEVKREVLKALNNWSMFTLEDE